MRQSKAGQSMANLESICNEPTFEILCFPKGTWRNSGSCPGLGLFVRWKSGPAGSPGIKPASHESRPLDAVAVNQVVDSPRGSIYHGKQLMEPSFEENAWNPAMVVAEIAWAMSKNRCHTKLRKALDPQVFSWLPLTLQEVDHLGPASPEFSLSPCSALLLEGT